MRVSEPFLRIASEQLIYISAVVGECLPQEADLYERGDTFALVGVPGGAYHLAVKSGGRNAKILSSAGVVAYLAEHLHGSPGVRLPAWHDCWEGRTVILFSNHRTGRKFDGSFTKVVVPYRKLVEGRVILEGNQLLIPAQSLENMAGRFAAFETEEAVLLRPAADGKLQPLPRANPRYVALDSQELVQFCHRRFGQKPRLQALRTDTSVFISKDTEALYRAARRPEPRALDVIPTPRAYLTLNNKWTMYFSMEAGRLLEGRVSVLEHNRLLALRPDPRGMMEVRSCAQQKYAISSKHLKERIQYRYPGEKRLILVPYKGLMLLTTDGRLPQPAPRERDFCQLQFYQPQLGTSWLRVCRYHVALSRWAGAALTGPFFVFEAPDALRFVCAADGAFSVCESKAAINSVSLAKIIRDKFGLECGDRLHAERVEDGLLMWPEGSPYPASWATETWNRINVAIKADRSLSALLTGNQLDFSVQAAKELGPRISLSEGEGGLLVFNHPDGPYPVHTKGQTGRKYISSAQAARLVRRSIEGHRFCVVPMSEGVFALRGEPCVL